MLSDGVLSHLRVIADWPDLSGTRYQATRVVGRGGMGTVYLAEDAELRREVAIKVLNVPDPDGDFSARLKQEARLLARLEHPNIVPVHDVGTLPDGRVYYAMKYVRGERLDEWRRRVSSRAAHLRIFQSICEAVAFAHSRGVIHRDLKPENVMVGALGEALVMDWGVAKILRADPDDIAAAMEDRSDLPTGPARPEQGVAPPDRTAQGAVIGTPAYMSPEQAGGRVDRIDEKTDVYALGAILYFLLSGRAPFDGPDAAEVLRRVKEGGAEPLRRLDPRIPRPLESLCGKAMNAAPLSRCETALELSEEVARHLDGLPLAAHRETHGERATRLLSRNRTLVLLIVTYALMRLGVLIAFGR